MYAIKRRKKELESLGPYNPQETDDPNIHLYTIKGQGNEFVVEIKYTSLYPFHAPYVRFKVPAPQHPHIHESGAMSLDLLQDWSPAYTTLTILQSLECMITHQETTV